MDRTEYGCIPPALWHWITFMVGALPVRSAPVCLELLVGALLSRRGFVTEALLSIQPQRHWTSYYHWLRHGRWSWKRLGQTLAVLLRAVVQRRVWYLVIDDSLDGRVSPKAPGSHCYYNHSGKPNRSRYLHGQCWVLLAAVVSRGRLLCSALPLLGRLQPPGAPHSKPRSAKALLRTVGPIFQDRPVRVLLDSGYLHRGLIEYSLAWGFQVIGQVRRDTALYALPDPPPPGRRGRRAVYGAKYTPEQVAALPVQRRRLWLYGKRQWAQYRSVLAKARFLKGQRVRVVWVQVERDDGTLTAPRLLLSTDPTLRPDLVIKAYARRWPVEPLFNQFRHAWGGKECWQQTRQVLARWVQIRFVAYTLIQLLALRGGPAVQGFTTLTPWRATQPLSAGRIRLGLQRIWGQVNVRPWWDPKSRQFRPPLGAGASPQTAIPLKAA